MPLFDLTNEGLSEFFRRFATGRNAAAVDPKVSDQLQAVIRIPGPSMLGEVEYGWAFGNARDPGAGNTASFMLTSDAPGGFVLDYVWPIVPTNEVNRFSFGYTTGNSTAGSFESSCQSFGGTAFNGTRSGNGLVTGEPIGTVSLRSSNSVQGIQQNVCSRYELSDSGGASPMLHPVGVYVPAGTTLVMNDIQVGLGLVFALGFKGRVMPTAVPDDITARS